MVTILKQIGPSVGGAEEHYHANPYNCRSYESYPGIPWPTSADPLPQLAGDLLGESIIVTPYCPSAQAERLITEVNVASLCDILLPKLQFDLINPAIASVFKI